MASKSFSGPTAKADYTAWRASSPAYANLPAPDSIDFNHNVDVHLTVTAYFNASALGTSPDVALP